jgi:hypothetical protein
MVQRTSLSEVFPGKDTGITGTGRRAYYAMLSRNTSSTFYGAAFFDNYAKSVFNVGYVASRNSQARSHIIQNTDSTHQYADAIWAAVGGTENYPTTNGTSSYVNGTNACGEFGNAVIDAYSDGTLNNIYNRYPSGSVKHFLNACAINSDHLNKRIVYILYSGVIRAIDRLYGSYRTPMENTDDFSVSSLNSSMQGSASYHRARKELTILSYVTSSGSYNVYTYQNVDFDLYPDPYVALNRPEVTRVNATLNLASSWGVNNSESYYNLKPITTDNGNVYVTVMFSSSGFALYQFTRSGTSAITGTYITQQSLTTSYGMDYGTSYGQRQMTSRDGTTVATFCPYYYYGAGMRCFMIDKTNNTYSIYGTADTNYGRMIMPFGDSGWMFTYAGNGYASNYTGNGSSSIYTKTPSGGFTESATIGYWPYHTGPNTTNYPGFTQVVDYVMLNDNKYGAK